MFLWTNPGYFLSIVILTFQCIHSTACFKFVRFQKSSSTSGDQLSKPCALHATAAAGASERQLNDQQSGRGNSHWDPCDLVVRKGCITKNKRHFLEWGCLSSPLKLTQRQRTICVFTPEGCSNFHFYL